MQTVEAPTFAWFITQAKARAVEHTNGKNFLNPKGELVAQVVDGRHYIRKIQTITVRRH